MLDHADKDGGADKERGRRLRRAAVMPEAWSPPDGRNYRPGKKGLAPLPRPCVISPMANWRRPAACSRGCPQGDSPLLGGCRLHPDGRVSLSFAGTVREAFAGHVDLGVRRSSYKHRRAFRQHPEDDRRL